MGHCVPPLCAEGVIEDYWRYVPQAGRAKLKKTPKGKRKKTNSLSCPSVALGYSLATNYLQSWTV